MKNDEHDLSSSLGKILKTLNTNMLEWNLWVFWFNTSDRLLAVITIHYSVEKSQTASLCNTVLLHSWFHHAHIIWKVFPYQSILIQLHDHFYEASQIQTWHKKMHILYTYIRNTVHPCIPWYIVLPCFYLPPGPCRERSRSTCTDWLISVLLPVPLPVPVGQWHVGLCVRTSQSPIRQFLNMRLYCHQKLLNIHFFQPFIYDINTLFLLVN